MPMNTDNATGKHSRRPTRTIKTILAMDGSSRADIREALGPARTDFDRCFSYLLWQELCREVSAGKGTSPTIVVTEKGKLFLHLLDGLDCIAHSNDHVTSF